LIFHNPVTKRAFGGGRSPPTRGAKRRAPIRLRRIAKRAERGKFSHLDLSRDCYKLGSENSSLLQF
jgi:hypothetical protein